ncbi:MAG TPA: hypothetical protein ENI07_02395 [Desulfobacterales bacterium]|nr:hypothetical protein [Desulfobacterales bacterium]
MKSIFSNIKSFFYRRESVIILASILLMSLVFSLHSARWVGWDSWAIWNMHAKFLTFSNNWTNLFTNHIEWTHPDYPLMLPSYIAIFWKLLGNFTPIVPSILAYIVLAAVPLSIYSSLKSKNLELLGLILFLIFALDSKFIYRAASQYSDTLLSLYILLTIILFNQFRTEKQNNLFLIGFFSASSCWIKNEGGLFFIVFSFYLILSKYKDQHFSGSKYFIGALPPLLVTIIFKLVYAPPNALLSYSLFGNNFEKLLDIKRYTTTISYFVITTMNHYPFIIYLSIIIFILYKKYYLSIDFMGLATVLLGYYAIFIISPYDLKWYLESAYSRLFHQLYPSFVYTMVTTLGNNYSFARINTNLQSR